MGAKRKVTKKDVRDKTQQQARRLANFPGVATVEDTSTGHGNKRQTGDLDADDASQVVDEDRHRDRAKVLRVLDVMGYDVSAASLTLVGDVFGGEVRTLAVSVHRAQDVAGLAKFASLDALYLEFWNTPLSAFAGVATSFANLTQLRITCKARA